MCLLSALGLPPKDSVIPGRPWEDHLLCFTFCGENFDFLTKRAGSESQPCSSLSVEPWPNYILTRQFTLSKTQWYQNCITGCLWEPKETVSVWMVSTLAPAIEEIYPQSFSRLPSHPFLLTVLSLWALWLKGNFPLISPSYSWFLDIPSM